MYMWYHLASGFTVVIFGYCRDCNREIRLFQRYITHDCQSYSFQLMADTRRTFLDEYDALELHISSSLSISGITYNNSYFY